MANFYENLDLRYPEKCILLEAIYWTESMGDKPKGKFRIPILMPLSESDKVSERTYRQTVNENGKSISKTVDVVNYLYLDIPDYLYGTKNDAGYYSINQGTEFIVVFIGGSIDIEDIKIIGRI